MREYLKDNIQEIQNYYKNRVKKISKADKIAIKKEFDSFLDKSFNFNQNIWTLPDLTKIDRLNNFCRSIKKKI